MVDVRILLFRRLHFLAAALLIASSIGTGLFYDDASAGVIAQQADTDGDGVPDEVDVDDDNDGILDQTECTFYVDSNPVAVVNGSFEEPDIVRQADKITRQWGTLPTAAVLFEESSVDGWYTSARDDQMEYWRSGFGDVTAHHGRQFAEINANVTASLYQDISTVPGQIMVWSFAHRGRTGVDTIALKVGPVDGPYITLDIFSTGNSAWSVYTGEYKVPIGQTATRFFYEALSTANGNTSMGNFLDDIRFYAKIATCNSDKDRDGVVNSLDLDSDNDGIPDNVEAQPTLGYVAPTGSINLMGIDSQYTNGLAPVNSDGAGEPDYLDADSDGDGTNDSHESGLEPGLDANGDGIGDGVSAGYADPNGIVDQPRSALLDRDADAGGRGDVDYRDAEVNLGGVADSFECGSVFYQVINDRSEGEGQLFRLNPRIGDYQPIGTNSGFSYNAMGYHAGSNFLYAIVHDKSTDGAKDSQGNSVEKGDLIKIDAGGETFRVGPTGFAGGSYSADVVGDSLWMRTSAQSFARVELKTGAGSLIKLVSSFGAADVALVGSKLYGVGGNKLFSIDTTAGEPVAVRVRPIANMNFERGAFGAIWATDSGGKQELFVSHNTTGVIMRINDYDSDSPHATLILKGQATGNNDGASCPLAPPPAFHDVANPVLLAIDDITLQPALCGVDASKQHNVAWNSVAYSPTYHDTVFGELTLLAAEPVKAGVEMVPPELRSVLTSQIWLDSDGNGQRDAGEAAVRGVRARIYQTSSGAAVMGASGEPKVAVTSDSGELIFQGLKPHTEYTIRLDDPKNFTPTGPLGNLSLGMQNNPNVLRGAGADAISAGLAVYGGDGTPEFTLTTGGPGTEINANSFNIIQPATIGDLVWDDLNGNGVNEVGEPGVADVRVTLIAADGQNVMSDTTDAGGKYLFTGVAPGLYTLAFDLSLLANARTFSPSHASGNPETDSDVDARGQTAPFVAEEGDLMYDIDVGLSLPESTPASIRGMAWEDTNNNGSREADEGGVAGVTIHLVDDVGLPLDTVTTDIEGKYEFGNLTPQKSYRIVFIPHLEQSITAQQNADSEAVDSDAHPLTGETDPITPGANQQVNNIDVGIVSKLSLGNRVWLDANNNGQLDDGEGGLPAVNVSLLDETENELQSTVTDATGRYLFTRLDAGTYSVRVEVPHGFVSSTDVSSTNAPNHFDNDDNGIERGDGTVQATLTLEANGGASSNANFGESDHGYPINGRLDPTSNGKAYYTVDFGFFRPVNLGNLVWIDDNGDQKSDATDNNGQFEPGAGEQAVANVVVEAWLDDGDELFDDISDGATPGTPDGIATTDERGEYLISGLAPGNYWVVVAADNFDEGQALSKMYSSAGAEDANSTAITMDQRDDGEDLPFNGAVVTRGPVTLSTASEPGGEVQAEGMVAATAGDTNLLVDFGFVPAPVAAMERNEAGEVIPEEGLPGEDAPAEESSSVETLDQPQELEISNPINERSGESSSIFLPFTMQ